MSVYKVIEIVGTSDVSWEDAAAKAVERAGKSLEDLRIGEVITQDVTISNGLVTAYRTKLSVSFKFKEG
jgi:flavin-binding protein dodecin